MYILKTFVERQYGVGWCGAILFLSYQTLLVLITLWKWSLCLIIYHLIIKDLLCLNIALSQIYPIVCYSPRKTEKGVLQGLVACTFYLSTQKAEAGGSWVWKEHGLQNEALIEKQRSQQIIEIKSTCRCGFGIDGDRAKRRSFFKSMGTIPTGTRKCVSQPHLKENATAWVI